MIPSPGKLLKVISPMSETGVRTFAATEIELKRIHHLDKRQLRL
jgi:hypothetical protein